MLETSHTRTRSIVVASFVLAALSACSGMAGNTGGASLRLTGAQEVPPVSTSAAGSGTIKVADDGAVSGSITTTGLSGTMAHIHAGAAGANGPVIIPLTKSADGVWSVPPGARLTGDQLKAYRAGDLYVNVHSDMNKGGEIRTQLKP